MATRSMIPFKLLRMKIKYSQRIYIYLFLLLTLFSISQILLFFNQEKELKEDVTEVGASVYVDLISSFIEENIPNNDQLYKIDSIQSILPNDIIIGVYDENGLPLYTNKMAKNNWDYKDNGYNVSVARAFLYGAGSVTHKSKNPNEIDYYYHSRQKGKHIICIGLPVPSIKLVQKSDSIFLVFSILLFILTLSLISKLYFETRKSLGKLKHFVFSFTQNNKSPKFESFKDDDLCEVQFIIAEIYKQLEIKELNTQIEREKLLEHFNFSEEGISFFTADNKNIYTNVHFIQYLSILLNETTFDVQKIIENPLFSNVNYFLQNRENNKTYSNRLYGNGKIFNVHVIIFEDGSYEIIIQKMLEAERDEMDASAITNSIAHELRTPVTSVLAYLETMLQHENLSPEKQKDFLERAYKQCIRLNEIMQDVILLSKTSYAPQFFLMEKIDLKKLINEIAEDIAENIKKNQSTLLITIPDDTIIKGNKTLLSSIFRNLCINALKYAGIGSTITINNYMTDDKFVYFSFSDNGKGVEEKHINRLFDRFYRVSDGRTRDTGGSGLGLAIVKDAVNFHHGEIYAKNRKEGGLEFIFTFRIS